MQSFQVQPPHALRSSPKQASGCKTVIPTGKVISNWIILNLVFKEYTYQYISKHKFWLYNVSISLKFSQISSSLFLIQFYSPHSTHTICLYVSQLALAQQCALFFWQMRLALHQSVMWLLDSCYHMSLVVIIELCVCVCVHVWVCMCVRVWVSEWEQH